MSNTVYFRGSRDDARRIVRRLAPILAGKEPDDLGIARGVHMAVGVAALSDIKQDFIRKSRGETGEDGVKWKPLTKEYLAYGRRFGRGEQAALKQAAGLGKEHRFAPGTNKGLLTAAQLKEWRRLFAMHTARLSLSMSIEEAKSKAAAMAWNALKAQGAKTKLDVFGSRQVDIGRDTGILFNSISPGELGGAGPTATYSKPTGPGGDQQAFEVLENGVIVGTNVAYAAAFNRRRRFIPDGSDVPMVWRERWMDVARQGILIGLRMVLGAA
jgi:hypothetical protein